MIKLYLYPSLFGLVDNNPFGLKVFSYLKLNNISFKTINTIDVSKAPRNQLPYIDDHGEIISDSNDIIRYIDKKYNLNMDENLNIEQQTMLKLVTSLLDNHMYWIISYSRWSDKKPWLQFKKEFMKSVPEIGEKNLEVIRQYNLKKYQTHGIGRYSSDYVYNSGIENIKIIESILGCNKYIFGDSITSLDCTCYAFLSSIYYFQLDTPLNRYIQNSPLTVAYIERLHQKINL